MKKILLLLIAIWTNAIFAQTENYKVSFENFQSSYNAENYQEIFNSFSAEMKKALPQEQTEMFFINLKSQVGEIISHEFINSENETGAIFKTKFDRAILGVYLTLNSQDQLAGLLIKPYEDPHDIETVSYTHLTLPTTPYV